MLTDALDEDSDGNFAVAFDLYTGSVELYLKLVKIPLQPNQNGQSACCSI